MKIVFAFACCAAVLGPVTARAQAFGQWTEGRTLALNERLGGGYLLLSSHTVGALGQLRISLHPGVDIGFQGGIQRVNEGPSRTALQLGFDGRGQVMAITAGDEVDASIGGCVGVETADNVTRLLVGPSAVASRRFDTTSGPITPYVGVALLFSRRTAFESQSNDISLPMRFGADFQPAVGLHFVGEIQLRASDDFSDSAFFSVGMQTRF